MTWYSLVFVLNGAHSGGGRLVAPVCPGRITTLLPTVDSAPGLRRGVRPRTVGSAKGWLGDSKPARASLLAQTSQLRPERYLCSHA